MSDETSGTIPEGGVALYTLAAEISAVLRPMLLPHVGKLAVGVVLIEVDRQTPVLDTPPGHHAIRFGSHTIIGNIPEDALSHVLRFVADQNETGRAVTVKRIPMDREPVTS